MVIDCDICPPMVVIGAGSFVMGSSAAEQAQTIADGVPKSWTDHENPQHTVNVKKFLMGQTEVTQGQWKAVMGSDKNPSRFNTCGDDCPVDYVGWNDAKAYITELNRKSGQQYRLPSEAQWEYAARGGTTTAFYTGNTITTDQANFDGKNGTYNGSAKGEYKAKTLKVKSFNANGFGLYDMHGNVWEWVEDVYHDNYNGAPTDGSAWLSGGDQTLRVLRGGGWGSDPASLRSAIRNWVTPGFRNNYNGFRLVRTLVTP